jgi:OOP family OmpA-OmpF porin
MAILRCILLGVFCFALPVAAQQKDDPKCKDHPLFTRMPDYWIHGCTQNEFDGYAFTVGKGKTEQVEGRLWKISYYPQAALKSKPSELQIMRNFENAAKRIGGSVLYNEKSRETVKLTNDGKEVWVEITTEFTGKYGLTIVEKKAMAQDIVANAEALAGDLKATGHTAVYGIYFDTGKSELKPESQQAIAEIARLMKKDAALRLYVVGHTDNVGGLDANMKLSQGRAEAVMHALVGSHGITATRLKAYGDGPYAPVSSNDTEAGRARNRRVELVIQ